MTHQLGGLSHDLHPPNQKAASDPQNIWRFWSIGASAPPSCGQSSVTFTGGCWWWCGEVGVQLVEDATEWWWGSG